MGQQQHAGAKPAHDCMSCETNNIVVPRARISSIRSNALLLKETSPTLNASSTTKTSGSRQAKRLNARRTSMPLL